MSASARVCFVAFAVYAFLAVSLLPSTAETAVLKRSTDDSSKKLGEPSICYHRTPCGWAVYVPFSRKIEYFMKNTCVCGSNRQCVRVDDDLSASAYIYRCQDIPPNGTIQIDPATLLDP